MSQERVGGYEVIRRLGAGGMGEVLLARDPKLERNVAIKVLRSDFAVDPVARKRFHREARALASLRHPGVVTIYEIGEDDGLDFIVMEFLEGTNLRTYMTTHSLDQQSILELALQIANAIGGAHGAGVLHRDIKPENIMVLEDGSIRVVDFGLARGFDEVEGAGAPSTDAVVDLMGDTLAAVPSESLADSDTIEAGSTPRTISTQNRITANTETILGTPAYMAPELFFGMAPSRATDLYSFGVLLYEMFSGVLPFDAKNMKQLLSMLVYDYEPPASLAGRGYASDEVSALVHDLLSNEPEERPTIADLLVRLEELAGISTEKVAPLPALERSGRAVLSQEIEPEPVRRARMRRRLLTALAASAVAIGGLLYLGSAMAPKGGSEARAPSLPADSIRIAVKPFFGAIPSYSHSETGVGTSAATVTATLLNRAESIRAIAPNQLLGHMDSQSSAGYEDSEWLRASHDVGAMFLVDTTLSNRDGILVATVSVTNLLDRSTRELGVVETTPDDFDSLMFGVASKVAAAAAPGEVLVAEKSDARRSIDSLALYEQALQNLYDNKWVPACVQLEQIVQEQPEFFEAWYHLAVASAWAAQPVEKSLFAANKAMELASTHRDRRLMEALIHYIGRDFLKAVPIARELAKRYPRDPEIAYLHAETVYHNGHYRQALALFDVAIGLAPRSQLATTHPLQHAEANGHEDRWQHYRSLRAAHTADAKQRPGADHKLLYAQGEYEKTLAAASESLGMRMPLLSTLQRDEQLDSEIAEMETLQGDVLAHVMARAVELGNRAKASELFDTEFARISANAAKPGNWLRIRILPRVLVAGDMKEELRTFLGYWALDGPEKNGSEEATLRAFAAPVLGDDSLVRREGYGSWREKQQAKAILAELDGRLAEAESIWTELLSDPSQWGDLMERFAYARVLHKQGKTRELQRICLELLRPKLWEPAYSVTRMRCREWGAMPKKRDPSGAFSAQQ